MIKVIIGKRETVVSKVVEIFVVLFCVKKSKCDG